MQVLFASNQLLDCYQDLDAAVRAWGPEVARRYIQRVDILFDIPTFGDLHKVHMLRLHPLRGRRAGEYAVTITGRWRLILPYDSDTQTVRVEEVSNHYDD